MGKPLPSPAYRTGAHRKSEATIEMLYQRQRKVLSRNLKVCFALMPDICQLRQTMRYIPVVDPAERETWKVANNKELLKRLGSLLQKNNLPSYLLQPIQFLFLATDDEIRQLEKYHRYPHGNPPEGYFLFLMPAFQFNTPYRWGWVVDPGYRVAILTVQEEAPWQVWGDTADISLTSLQEMLRASGDFIVRGNLNVFGVDSWRELGVFMAKMKKESGMGKPLGLVAGRQKGRRVRLKRIMRKLSWPEIQMLVVEDPGSVTKLQNEYAHLCVARFREEFSKSHMGQDPPLAEQKLVRKSAISNFARRIKKPIKTHAK